MKAALLAALALSTGTSLAAMTTDIASLWDFADPAASERRFLEARAKASADDTLSLTTQVARTWSIRRDFERARAILADVEPKLAGAGPEPRVRYELEMGRTWISATHPKASRTPEALERARTHFTRALDLARAAKLDGLAIDAIHMMAFLDTAPADQLRWANEALALVEASSQAEAKRWEPSIRNNLGYALHQQGRLDEALAQFRMTLALREKAGDAAGSRVARWMVAWTLRGLGRLDEALALQLRLERENEAAGKPDPYVFEELALLYRAQGNEARAKHYESLRRPA